MINFEALENVKLAVIAKHLKAQGGTDAELVEGSVVSESTDDHQFLYFRSTRPGATKGLARYHQLIYSSMFFQLCFEDSNVIDGDKDYSIDDLKHKFKNWLKWNLEKLG